MEAMPLSRLASRLIAEEKRLKEEEEQRGRDILFHGYVVARVMDARLIADKPMPQTESEQKRKTPQTEILKAKHQREEHDNYWRWGLRGLQNFGKWFGMPNLWGEPEEEPQHNQTDEERIQTFREWEAAAEADFMRRAEEQLAKTSNDS